MISGITSATAGQIRPVLDQLAAPRPQAASAGKDNKLHDAFQDFVAGTFFKQMIKSMRSSQEKPAYFHGGTAEDLFQGQLDQQIAEDLAKHQGAAFTDSLFAAFSHTVRSSG